MSDHDLSTPAAFWQILEHAAGDLSALDASLVVLSREGLENFFGFTTILSMDAVYEDYLEDPGGNPLSEDSLEELGWWIVSQGLTTFDAVTSEQLSLPDALRIYWEVEGAPPWPRTWVSGGERRFHETNHLSLAAEAYRERFGEGIDDGPRGQEIVRRAYRLRDAAYAAEGG